MRNLLALAAFALIAFGVIGYFRGWYTIKDTPAPDGHHIAVDVNTKQVQEDWNAAKQEVGELLQKK
jgi:hypothetical protein